MIIEILLLVIIILLSVALTASRDNAIWWKRKAQNSEGIFLRAERRALEHALKMQQERDMWRDRWKEGAFELDPTTLANLAEEDEN